MRLDKFGGEVRKAKCLRPGPLVIIKQIKKSRQPIL